MENIKLKKLMRKGLLMEALNLDPEYLAFLIKRVKIKKGDIKPTGTYSTNIFGHLNKDQMIELAKYDAFENISGNGPRQLLILFKQR